MARCKAITNSGKRCKNIEQEGSGYCHLPSHAPNPVGAPPKYETPSQMQQKINEYFATTPESPTQTGLALHLGFESRQSLFDYKKKSEFSYTIKKAFSKIDQVHEKNLLSNGCSGSIFYLKNRGWTDKQQIEHAGGVTLFEALTEEHAKPKSHYTNGTG